MKPVTISGSKDESERKDDPGNRKHRQLHIGPLNQTIPFPVPSRPDLFPTSYKGVIEV